MPAGPSTSCTTNLDSGRRFRVLNIVDDMTRECLAAVPDTSISGVRHTPRLPHKSLSH